MYVEMKHIYKKYGDFLASDDVSFGIEKGKLVALLGPSGSGKTTLLRIIAGLEDPNEGDIYIDGKRMNDIPASKRGIGFVFQNYALFRYMTVFDNVAFGMELQKMPKRQIKERVTELLKLTGLSGMEKRYPNQLSGGQRQRVAFARALAPNPQVLLLDEPFAAIDAKVRTELRSWLKEMVETLGITSIFVTHDQDEAVEVADEIIKLAEQTKAEDMHELMFVYELKERLVVCLTLIAHLRARKETRWHSFCENLNYPEKSDDWLKYVNSEMEDGKIKIILRDLVGKEETYEHCD